MMPDGRRLAARTHWDQFKVGDGRPRLCPQSGWCGSCFMPGNDAWQVGSGNLHGRICRFSEPPSDMRPTDRFRSGNLPHAPVAAKPEKSGDGSRARHGRGISRGGAFLQGAGTDVLRKMHAEMSGRKNMGTEAHILAAAIKWRESASARYLGSCCAPHSTVHDRLARLRDRHRPIRGSRRIQIRVPPHPPYRGAAVNMAAAGLTARPCQRARPRSRTHSWLP